MLLLDRPLFFRSICTVLICYPNVSMFLLFELSGCMTEHFHVNVYFECFTRH